MGVVETVTGLVLRETVYKESDKIFDLLTAYGIRTVRARGARKPGSKYGALTQAFVYGDYSLRQSGNFCYLDSAVSRNMFYGLRSDLTGLALAAYFSELVRRTATEQFQPQILRLFVCALHYLSEHTRAPELVKPVFELRLMAELGMMPAMVCCSRCMQYDPPEPVFCVSAGNFLCRSCMEATELPETEQLISGTSSVLRAVRHVIYSEPEKVFLFRLHGESLRLFGRYAEAYTLTHMGMHHGTFPALKYYEQLMENQPETAVIGNEKNEE